MEFKKLDENRFQCLLKKEDLENNNVSLDDFFKNNTEKIHELLDVVMREAQKSIDVVMDGGMVSLQLAPQPNQSVLLTVSCSKDDFGNIFKNIGENVAKTFNSQGKIDSGVLKDYKNKLVTPSFPDFDKEANKSQEEEKQQKAQAMIYRFNSLSEIEDFCCATAKTWGVINDLYKDEGSSQYYLIVNKGRCSKKKFDNITVALTEYSADESEGDLRAVWIKEHYQIIIKNNAINTIKKYCGGNHTC